MNHNFSHIDRIIEKYHYDQKALIPILQKIQDSIEEQYISEEVAQYIAEKLHISSSKVYEVLTFFSALHHRPKGKYLIQLCDSTVCRLKKNYKIQKALEQLLHINIGETTEDKMFTLEYTACFGACDISPAIRINKKVYGNLNEEKVKKIIDSLRRKEDE